MPQIALRPTIQRQSAQRRLAPRRRQSGIVFSAAFETELGWTAIAERDEVLVGTVFGHASESQATEALRRNLELSAAMLRPDVMEFTKQPRSIANIAERLTAYAAGEEVDFSDVAVGVRHLTDFGRRVVKACRRIPRGETRSYGELAAACGSPGAARAVGQVMARNRYPLVVPCHRVLAAGGLLGGFTAPQGLAMKQRLLELEGATNPTCAR